MLRNLQLDTFYHLISRVAHWDFYLVGKAPRGDNKVAHDFLAVLAEGPRRPAGLRRELGVYSPNYFTSCYLAPLAAAGFIAAEGAPHSPQRTYRLTAKGRKALA